MSFILDALKKSDQQRRRSGTPTLTSVQAPPEIPGQTPLLMYSVIATVLIGAGVVTGWMHPWTAEPATPAVEKLGAEQLALKARNPTPSNPPLYPETNGKQGNALQLRNVTPLEPIPQFVPSPAPATPNEHSAENPPAVNPAVVVASDTKEARKPLQAARTSASHADDAPQEQVVMAMEELPASVQAEIPKMSISAHAFSTRPKASFVFINDRMMREEEVLASGLKLENITQDGMIFSYKGYRFRRRANQ